MTHTAYNDVLRSVQNLYLPVRKPHREITRVADTTSPQLARGLRIFVVPTRTDIAREHNLANLLAVFGYIYNLVFWQPLLDHSCGLRRYEAVALARHVRVALLIRNVLPSW